MKADKFKKKMRRIKRQGEQYKLEQQLRDAYAEYWPNRKKQRTSTVMLIVIVIAIISYTIASFWVQYHTGVQVDSTLTTCFYTFWGSELVMLTTLKTSKIIKGHKDDDQDGDTCG